MSLQLTCKTPIIANVVEVYKSVLVFFNTSPKRKNLLIHIVEGIVERKEEGFNWHMSKSDGHKEMFLISFYLAFPIIVETFEPQSLTSLKKFILKGVMPKVKLKLLSS